MDNRDKKSIEGTAHKNTTRDTLKIEEIENSRKISSEKRTVKTFFGRLCICWSVFSSNWKFCETFYDHTNRMCVNLTKLNIRDYALRASDSSF